MRLGRIGLLSLLCIVAGCQGSGDPEPVAEGSSVEEAKSTVPQQDVVKSPEEQLKSRAVARWEAMINRDAKGAYAFVSPGMKEAVPLRVFEGRVMNRTMVWKRAVAKEVLCEEPDVCTVGLEITYIYVGTGMADMMGKESASNVYEKWIRLNDQWWYVPSK